MEMRSLGSTGLKVSRLCLGTMTFGTKWGHINVSTQAEADAVVALAIDHGVNFFDTADGYSAGESEEQLGRALKGRPRDQVIVATKVRGRTGPGPNDVGLSRHHILNQIDNSLRRLGMDHVDLYQTHAFDDATPVEETLAALDHCVRAGKVRYIGASNHAGWQLMKALATSDALGTARYVTLQALYNPLQRDLERELVPLVADQGLGILPWSPLAGGFLSGKYRRDRPRPEGARRSDPDKAYLKFDEAQGFDLVDVLERVARAHGGTVVQAVHNWLLAKPGVTSIVIGARNPAQLEENLKAVAWTITPEEVLAIDQVAPPAPAYPYWMLEQFHSNR